MEESDSKINPNKKILLAFDFDHTIIDENTDTLIWNLAPDKHLPSEIKDQYQPAKWTRFM